MGKKPLTGLVGLCGVGILLSAGCNCCRNDRKPAFMNGAADGRLSKGWNNKALASQNSAGTGSGFGASASTTGKVYDATQNTSSWGGSTTSGMGGLPTSAGSTSSGAGLGSMPGGSGMTNPPGGGVTAPRTSLNTTPGASDLGAPGGSMSLASTGSGTGGNPSALRQVGAPAADAGMTQTADYHSIGGDSPTGTTLGGSSPSTQVPPPPPILSSSPGTSSPSRGALSSTAGSPPPPPDMPPSMSADMNAPPPPVSAASGMGAKKTKGTYSPPWEQNP